MNRVEVYLMAGWELNLYTNLLTLILLNFPESVVLQCANLRILTWRYFTLYIEKYWNLGSIFRSPPKNLKYLWRTDSPYFRTLFLNLALNQTLANKMAAKAWFDLGFKNHWLWAMVVGTQFVQLYETISNRLVDLDHIDIYIFTVAAE